MGFVQIYGDTEIIIIIYSVIYFGFSFTSVASQSMSSHIPLSRTADVLWFFTGIYRKADKSTYHDALVLM